VLSVAIPCRDETGNIALWKSDLFPELERLGTRYEVLAVDDGSTDGTYAALQKFSRGSARLRVLRHAVGLGLGAALKSALREAHGDWFVPLDADLTFHPRHIAGLLEAQRSDDADCVSGSPFLGGMRDVPLGRRMPSLALNALYRALFDRRLTSYTPMLRLYRTAALRSLDIRSDGFEVSAEILVRLHQAGKKIVEVPVPLASRRSGTSKLRRWRELRNHLALIARLLAG